MESSNSRRSERRRRPASIASIALFVGLPFLASVASVASITSSSRADEATSTELEAARAEFVKGAELAKKAQWAEALAAFERSAKLRPHAVTTYDIGACQRAIGQYTLARKTLAMALDQDAKAPERQLSESLAAEVRGWIAEIDGSILATLVVAVHPPDATIAVDGRPLEMASTSAGATTMIAGTLSPGSGVKVPGERFLVRVNPGTHIVTLSRKGYTDAVVTRTVAPASSTALDLELDRLPATLHVTANVDGAVVTVDDLDVGVAPVDLSRTAGVHHVVVRKPGYVTYDTKVDVQAGEKSDLSAKLEAEKPSLLEKWWFWTTAAVVVGGATVGTYFLVHKNPEPQRPALNGGGLGWTVQL